LNINNFWENFQTGIIKFLRSLKPKLSIKLYKIVELSIEHLEKMPQQPDEVTLFLESINLIQSMADKLNLQVKIALDEFQDIYNLTQDKKIIDKLRSTIQHHNNLAFIFCGSHESLMNQIFLDKRSAFFHFSRVISLGALGQQELYEHIINKFAIIKVTIDAAELLNTLNILECHPYYSMKTMQILHGLVIINKLKHISADLLQQALDIAYEETKTYLEDIINYVKLKAHHFDMLISIAKKLPSSLEPLNSYRVKQSLVNMGLIRQIKRGEYIIIDAFLKCYLKSII
jgi:AAA+ ATPase superfamily predicted ATPase